MNATAVIVLAAGKGTRMKSERAKVLHPVAWRPMLAHVLDALAAVKASRQLVVIGHAADSVRAACLDTNAFPGGGLELVEQREQKGTGHAVQMTKDALAGFRGTVLVVPGDVPLVRGETLAAFLQFHATATAPLSVLTTRPPDATGYGRIVRQPNAEGGGWGSGGEAPGNNETGTRIARIVEHRDATDTEKLINEINTGIIAADAEFLFKALAEIRPDNSQKELYLTDVIAIAAKAGTPGAVYACEPASEFEGINDRAQLSRAEKTLFARVAQAHMIAGITILDPATTRIDPRARIGVDTVLHPGVEIRGACVIGAANVIETGTIVDESVIGAGVHVKPYCVITRARAADGCVIGPFAHLRPEADLAEGVHVGNYVEVKKSTIGKGSKANHLAYLGDATIGSGVNVGAGTITCNYDGFAKHRTVIEDGVFIGSDTQLVAPVTVGRDAVVAAGSTITKDVPPGSLALSRTKQTEIADYATKRKARVEAKKASDAGEKRKKGSQ